ncbi:hypothetical protein [Shewanella japonica]|uniref:Uncharacterized protein n=1 Tax=Shewanella japonica TaxID=93973 RepID=A0ABM6JJN7_9GAMM|nr:hypothetical protein [Shewanella japonica]ARD22473.1 hypothetical protein SJ2017_2176 [Shewanella japonica]
MFREMNGKELESVLGGKKYKVTCIAKLNDGSSNGLGSTTLPGTFKKNQVNSMGGSQCRQWALNKFGANGGSPNGARVWGSSVGANGKGAGPQVDVIYF